MKRPTFYYNNDKQNPIRAVGLILTYINKQNQKLYLMNIEQKNNKTKFCDIGGKTDYGDKSPYDTILRETKEETNNNLFGVTRKQEFNHLFKLLFQKSKITYHYSQQNKYLVYQLTFSFNTLPNTLKSFMRLPIDRLKNKEYDLYHEYKWIKHVKKIKYYISVFMIHIIIYLHNVNTYIMSFFLHKTYFLCKKKNYKL